MGTVPLPPRPDLEKMGIAKTHYQTYAYGADTFGVNLWHERERLLANASSINRKIKNLSDLLDNRTAYIYDEAKSIDELINRISKLSYEKNAILLSAREIQEKIDAYVGSSLPTNSAEVETTVDANTQTESTDSSESYTYEQLVQRSDYFYDSEYDEFLAGIHKVLSRANQNLASSLMASTREAGLRHEEIYLNIDKKLDRILSKDSTSDLRSVTNKLDVVNNTLSQMTSGIESVVAGVVADMFQRIWKFLHEWRDLLPTKSATGIFMT